MQRILPAIAIALLSAAEAGAQTSWRPPPDSERYPSKWGANDQRGSGNHMGPASVLKAARLIVSGQVFELGRVLAESMPLPAGRRFEIFTKRTRYDPGTNRRSSNEELVVAEIGRAQVSAWRPPSGSRARIRCSSAPTTAAWKWHRIPILSCADRCISSCSS